MPPEGVLHLLPLVEPQQPVIHEDAGEPVAHGAVHQRRGDGGVHAAREAADHPGAGPHLLPDLLDFGPDEVTREALKILRRADAIYLEEIRGAGLYDEIWQAFAVLLPVRSVGVQGDGRSYDQAIALRAVTSRDGMTADWYPFPPEVLAMISNRIANEVRGVNRVVYDVSSKPPATIEWE